MSLLEHRSHNIMSTTIAKYRKPTAPLPTVPYHGYGFRSVSLRSSGYAAQHQLPDLPASSETKRFNWSNVPNNVNRATFQVDTGVSSFVYTCNEAKRMMEMGGILIEGTRACAVLPAAVKFPFNDDPYTWYLWNTYLVDMNSGMQWDLAGLQERDSFCVDGVGPWKIRSDDPSQFKCSSKKYKYAEIIFIITSEEPNIVRADTSPTAAKFGKGTHVFVAPEGSLFIEKNNIADGKETTLQFYSGAGANEAEERFALTPEKFVAGTSTVIIGPVTTIVIEDDVTVELTITSFEDALYIPAQSAFSYSLMSSGRANDLQSSRPSILVSNNLGDGDESVSLTGTVRFDENVATELSIGCFNTVYDITNTGDLKIEDCLYLNIYYKGSLTQADIDRSSEMIYLQISPNNSSPVISPTPSTASPVVPNVTSNYCNCGLADGWTDNWDPSEIWVDLIVILDTSASMGDSLEEAKSLLTSFISPMSTDTAAEFYSRIGVISASDTIDVVYNLNMSSTDSLDSIQQHKVEKIDVGAAFQAALKMFADGSKMASYRENARQIVYYLTNSAPGANMNGVDDFKTSGGIIIVNDFILEGEVAEPALKSLASDNFFFTDLSENYVNNLAVLCEANCFCSASKHAFNDDDISPRTEANRGCFHPVNNGIPQPKARETCQKEGASLVSIHDQNKEFFVNSVVSEFGTKKKYWIGLENDGNKWNWDDKSTDPFSDWDVNQPDTNGGKLECAYAVQTTGLNVRWTASNCAMGGVIYVCESVPCSRGNQNC